MQQFYSNGKLLITGEYAVLDGAKSLAVPTRFGQSLTVEQTDSGKLNWSSKDEKGNLWFQCELDLSLNPVFNDETTNRLLQILKAASRLNPDLLTSVPGLNITTTLDFPRDWGLGTSSTLINNIAQWAKVDPFTLLEMTFGGSGYDIACAQHNNPITYQLKSGNPIVNEVGFNPPFTEELFFVHLNKKQNSRSGIAHYKSLTKDKNELIRKVSSLTDHILNCQTTGEFEILINTHEQIISEAMLLPTVKESLFSDYSGAVKSLGAWGGDFVLVTGNDEQTHNYFQKKGYNTVISYEDMVLS